jgi:hypothetical protein
VREKGKEAPRVTQREPPSLTGRSVVSPRDQHHDRGERDPGAATLALELDDPEEAALLIGACQESSSESGGSPNVYEASSQAAVAASPREKLEEADAAIERGRRIGVEAATAVAFELGSRLEPAGSGGAG